MGLRYRSFTDEEFAIAVKESMSIAKVLKKLNLKAAGANYRMFKILVKQLGIDCSHFTGQGHLKGKTHSWNEKMTLDEILTENSQYMSSRLKKRLVKEKYFKDECSNCHLSEWMGERLSIELHHINGEHTDNRIENLQLLCPNCHSLTKNYKGKKNKDRPAKKLFIVNSATATTIASNVPRLKQHCIDCGKEVSRQSKARCFKCSQKVKVGSKPKIQWPSIEELLKYLETMTVKQLGEKLNVSDGAIYKHIKKT